MIMRLFSVFVVILMLSGLCFAEEEELIITHLWADDYNFDVSEDVIVSAQLTF